MRWPGRGDLLIAAVATFIAVAGSAAASVHWAAAAGHHYAHLDALGYLLAAAPGPALAWRRAWPTLVLLWAYGCVIAFGALGFTPGPVYLPLIIAFFTAVTSGDRRVAYAVLAAGYILAARPVFGHTSAATQLGLAAWLLVLAAAAEITRIRARFRRAEQDQRARAQEAQRELAARRAGEQRLRIAQDLHDVLAHQLALITVQANVGLAMLEREPGRAGEALSAIKAAGNSALGELQTVLGMLRTDGAAPRGPVPLLSRAADIGQLADGTQSAGLAVRRESAGTVRPLPGPVDQVAYRIVQEALTNAVRHAGPGTGILLRIEYGDQALRLTVDDDGRGRTHAGGPGGGNGLPGMRERVRALGGAMEAARKPGGGFRVDATLPVPDGRAHRPAGVPAREEQ